MRFRPLLLLAALASGAMAALNQPCEHKNGTAGVCISTANCAAGGGTYFNNGCPTDPKNIKCCIKPTCANGDQGNCRWISDCAVRAASNGTVHSNCPGPKQMTCCSSKKSGFGGYRAAPLPPSSSCRPNARNGAKAVLKQFPGWTREMGCWRRCWWGDHCSGRAVDFMLSDAGYINGAGTIAGRPVAEWIMNNASRLRVKYIIWGQRIWNSSRDRTARPWNKWRTQKTRGGITPNHWDHVHVSFF